MPGIYLKQGDLLIAMREAPYSAETVLQELVARHPEVLAGDQDDGRLLLVRREASVSDEAAGAARWSVDHLFLDGDGVPVLVEAKRSTDSRIRREVVGQMLDYAAGAAHWTVDELQGWLAERCLRDGAELNELLTAHTTDVDAFWASVGTNIGARKLRLVFVADVIPPELRSVVEFLNEQMTNCEVVAVEVKQYLDHDARHTIVVPTVLGQTERARAVKGIRAKPLPWNLETVLDATADVAGQRPADVVRAVADWVVGQPDLRLGFGHGTTREWGSMQVVPDDARNVSPFIFWTSGGIEIAFQYMITSHWAPFDEESGRRELQRRLNAIPGVDVPDERLARRPSISMGVVASHLSKFLDVMRWTFDQARAAPTRGGVG